MNVLYKIAAMMVIGLGLFNLGACNQTTGNGKSAGPPASVTKAKFATATSDPLANTSVGHVPTQQELISSGRALDMTLRPEEVSAVISGAVERTISYHPAFSGQMNENTFHYLPSGRLMGQAENLGNGDIYRAKGYWVIGNDGTSVCRSWDPQYSNWGSGCHTLFRSPDGTIFMVQTWNDNGAGTGQERGVFMPKGS